MLDEDDNKRRRNLIGYALLIWATWFLDIKVQSFALIGISSTNHIDPWRHAMLSMGILVYLVWRYATRAAKANGPGASKSRWDDWHEAAPLAHTEYLQFVVAKFGDELRRLWRVQEPALKKSQFIANLEFFPGLKNNFIARKGNPSKPVRFTNIAVQQFVMARWWSFERTICTGEFQIEFFTLHHGREDQIGIGVPIEVPVWLDRLWRVRARLRVHLATAVAVDVWLPYYLAVAAAYAIIYRYVGGS